MNKDELLYNIKLYSAEQNIPLHLLEPISKDMLVVGEEYCGICRNAYKAVWNGEKFEYSRYKFGSTFIDRINHYEDDDGYDLFIPIKILDKNLG